MVMVADQCWLIMGIARGGGGPSCGEVLPIYLEFKPKWKADPRGPHVQSRVAGFLLTILFESTTIIVTIIFNHCLSNLVTNISYYHA